MVAWDDTKKFFVEVDNNETHHTQERCKSMKEIKLIQNLLIQLKQYLVKVISMC
jgi:hypothetical protein